MTNAPSLFQRLILPGFAFKAVVIGGGYATGRELAEFFLPNGAWGGLLGMVAAALLWSLVCTATFLFAQATHSYDYRSFFGALLGRGWVVFEIGYLALLVLMLSVFGAAAGEIGAALFGWPKIAGTFLLAGGIAMFAGLGNEAVEGLFKYVSFFLYGVYLLFLVLALAAFGERIPPGFMSEWSVAGLGSGLRDGLSYAGYNIVGATAILPVVRHMQGRGDAIAAGMLCGPLAMLPALLFFVCMIAFYPEIGVATLPSEYLVARLNQPLFHMLFQAMIFAALLESGTGGVHAINERAAGVFRTRGRDVPLWLRPTTAAALLVLAIFIADRIGLVALIGSGYRALSYLFFAVYVLPVLTLGAWIVFRPRREALA